MGFWGHIRTTMDIDIVIQVPVNKINPFLSSVKEEAYVDEQGAIESIADRSMFNIINNETCFKVDIIPLNEKDEYEIENFKNRIKVNFQNKEIFVAGPEGLIISKLLWSKSAGGSERQLKDCMSIYALNREKLNLDYLKKWVQKLGIEEDFNKLTLDT